MCLFAIGAPFLPHSDDVVLGSHWVMSIGLAVSFLILEIRKRACCGQGVSPRSELDPGESGHHGVRAYLLV